MNIAAAAFTIYLSVGLLLMTVAVASRRKAMRVKALETGVVDEVSAGIMVFIALLWPIWLFVCATKQRPNKAPEPTPTSVMPAAKQPSRRP